MKLKVISIDGKKSSDIEISDKIFSLKPNERLIHSLIDWQINHFKPRTAKTKQRGEIKGSTSKIYAQKGTGGARHSSRKAPIFVGGGVAHGPKGDNYKIPLRMLPNPCVPLASIFTVKASSEPLHLLSSATGFSLDQFRVCM